MTCHDEIDNFIKDPSEGSGYPRPPGVIGRESKVQVPDSNTASSARMIGAVQGHSYMIEAGVRQLPPENGWRRLEATGQCDMTCECGLKIAGPTDDVGYLATAHQMHHLRPVAQHG